MKSPMLKKAKKIKRPLPGSLKEISPSRNWQVQILIKSKGFKGKKESLRRTIKKILLLVENKTAPTKLPSTVSQLSVLFTGDTEIQKLNRLWRGKDKATDVLSFSQLEGMLNAFVPVVTLGDIVISLDTAKVQARKFACSLDQEVLRLMIHGVLHLFGYDHVGVKAATASKMRKFERDLMRLLSRARK